MDTFVIPARHLAKQHNMQCKEKLIADESVRIYLSFQWKHHPCSPCEVPSLLRVCHPLSEQDNVVSITDRTFQFISLTSNKLIID